jgi:ribosomal protein S12 methylthiotransferase accessory factor
VRFFQAPPATSLRNQADIAVGFFAGADHRRRCVFERWVHRRAIPSLIVASDAARVLIGPLSLPERAGCGHCAHERIRAASALAGTPIEALPVIARRALLRELRVIVRGGASSSPLVDHVLAVDPSESMHRVVPLSHCVVCGGAAAFPAIHHPALALSPDDSPDDLLTALDGWLDPVTGVLSGLRIEPAEIELPIVITVAPPRVLKKDGTPRQLPIGWGKGLSLSGALLSAVGEAIERYSASLPDPRRIVWERLDDLDGDVLDPRAFAFYSKAQHRRKRFPYARFDAAAQHPWISGRWLHDGGDVWVPAVLAFLWMRLRAEQLICQGTSNGLAASGDGDDAALRAVFELVERDAFMTAWMTATRGRRLQLDGTLDPPLRRILDGIEQLGAAIEIYLLPTSTCGTTILCLARGDGVHYPGATIGLGADLDPRSALRQAILELGQTGPHLRRLMQSKMVAAPAKPNDVHEMLDHAAFYFPSERAKAFDRLRRRGAPLKLASLKPRPRSLAQCAAALTGAGVRVALVDVTSPDVATGPFRVIRAVSPDLQPISYGYGLDFQPVERVRRLGLAANIPPIHPIW